MFSYDCLCIFFKFSLILTCLKPRFYFLYLSLNQVLVPSFNVGELDPAIFRANEEVSFVIAFEFC